ncbi:MAG TPA: L-histidine N(alpha)-methyltransferase [Longimicrobiales bacterium]|nr:L-histidine N(alpha)-methyltransferase [Longimicrobiales bacterium]
MPERMRWRRSTPPPSVTGARTDLEPVARVELLHDVVAGLSQPQSELPPKYFYDERGSRLFARITALEEYYLTRTETALLASAVVPWLERLHPRALLELGAGNAEKTRALLAALPAGALYLPVDISDEYLRRTAARLRAEFPQLHVQPIVADMTRPLALPARLPAPAVFAFLGSTIGNFDTDEAVRLLARLRAVLRREDRLVLGADLVKDVATLERAYNDDEGLTAEFNRNVLHVLNRELQTDFDVAAWQHLAFFDPLNRRIEMHLVALEEQRVQVPGWRTVTFRRGESIRTEISCKYDRLALEAMLRRAGLELEEWFTDDSESYVLLVARAGPGT